MKPHPFASLRLLPLVAFGLVGCQEATLFGNESVASFHAPSTAPLEASLEPAASCDDLLTRLRADAVAKLETDAWQLSFTGDYGWGYPVFDASVGVFPGTDTAGGAPTAAEGTPRYSDTNTQVAGVDEADFVETDGNRIYLLHDRHFRIVEASPPGTADEGAATLIEGAPSAMFVANGRAVVLSSVYASSYYPIYGLYPTDGIDAGPAPMVDAGQIDPMVDAGVGEPVDADASMPEPGDAGVPVDEPPYWSGGSTSEVKVTVLDVSGATPVVVSERYLEGWYVDARRHDDVVRVLVQTHTSFELGRSAPPSSWDWATGQAVDEELYLAQLAAWRDAERARLEAATLEDLMPASARIVDGARVADPRDCTSVYLPPTGQTGDGTLQVLAFSMSAPEAVDVDAIAGRADVVFANHEVLLVAQRDYRFGDFSGVSSEETALHQFRLSGATNAYEASGKVLGSIRNQFSLDEANGTVRVVATERQLLEEPTVGPDPAWEFGGSRTASHVVTLQRSGNRLVGVGQTVDFGVDEQVQSSRFLGDKVYVVTFRQIDPLFVIDVADPTNPTVLGELKIPGFSTYMHPLGDSHLLTIGQEVPDTGGGSVGLALQIFDVTQPTAPTLVHKHVMLSANSLAGWDHKAFIFDAEAGLLAIPVESYDGAFTSTLQVFDVSLATGFALRGTVHHEQYFDGCVTDGFYSCNYSASMRRGLFIGDFVYAISYAAVTAHPLADLATTSDTYTLPAPTFWYYGRWGI